MKRMVPPHKLLKIVGFVRAEGCKMTQPPHVKLEPKSCKRSKAEVTIPPRLRFVRIALVTEVVNAAPQSPPKVRIRTDFLVEFHTLKSLRLKGARMAGSGPDTTRWKYVAQE